MKYLPGLLLSVLLLSSCAKANLRNAEDSLIGDWKVVRIFSVADDGNNDNLEETGNLGAFSFADDRVDYDFTVQNINENGSSDWNLVRTKQNAGFTREEVYTLNFASFTFDCAFGDQTSDAEKKAKTIRLTAEMGIIADFSLVQLWLEKE